MLEKQSERRSLYSSERSLVAQQGCQTKPHPCSRRALPCARRSDIPAGQPGLKHRTVDWFVRTLLIGILGCVLHVSVFASEPASHERFIGLLKELRCLVCQNQDLADSHAPLANRLREEVQRLMIEGKSDQEIREYLAARYGDFILFKPPLKPSTALLWFGPGIFLLAGITGLLIFISRGKRHA